MLSQAEVIQLHARSPLSPTDHEVEHRLTDAELEKSVKIYIYTALNWNRHNYSIRGVTCHFHNLTVLHFALKMSSRS